jgi:hypothetical protein
LAILPAMISKGEAPFACGTGGVCFATCAVLLKDVLLRGALFAGTALLAVFPAGAETVDTAMFNSMGGMIDHEPFNMNAIVEHAMI